LLAQTLSSIGVRTLTASWALNDDLTLTLRGSGSYELVLNSRKVDALEDVGRADWQRSKETIPKF
jgi:hypothetical protein